ncbi:MAG TPA: DUF4360 domain-containing protein [Pilimelia sp.]|nr:DUF4360 domain-containing protein [Pilimelia sp.]
MRTATHASTASLLATAALAAAAPLHAHAGPADPPQVQLQLTAHGGDGCPRDAPDRTRVTIDPQGGFTATFDAFTARITAPPSAAQSRCSFAFTATVPAGYRLALSGAAHSGVAHLSKGRAQVSTTYFRTGAGRTTVGPAWTATRPFEGGWRHSHALEDVGSLRCGGTDELFITHVVRVDGDEGNTVTVHSAGTGASAGWPLELRPCTR